ncbi:MULTISPECIES: threonine ammonia-lyase [unclassified Ancylobacter]|uniref:threonine ammonia-lyase n=1 Tax=unclassified Ancylobacter TaxID=2626613 RepID=UPI0022711D43|nr:MULTISPECIES: threonine ammonia-lyase [unclassified Ancylobacter]WAC26476.1 threonine ammonia-lyase [Ancylobacter sp. SL191]WGD31157.1 threonine ammonia-lyase [Ancylobacter sp. WKF20]
MTLPVTPADVAAARSVLAGAVLRTPTLPAPRLSAITGAHVFVKYENLQVTASFKERGALVKLASLSPAERAAGVVAMSAGNHAQAVAYHATRLGIRATIVMPKHTPMVKVAATEAHGARVVLHGESVGDASVEADRIARDEHLVWVHPYDDAHVIAGQGSIAAEMIEDAPELDALLVPVGGGGMVSGMAVAARAMRPSLDVVGVETSLYPSMWNALHQQNRPCEGATLAEGIAVKQAGTLTREIVSALVSDVVLVDEPTIERAVNLFLTQQKTLSEGAGAAGLAALLADPDRFRGRNVGLIVSGGNIDPRIVASVMMRELEREERIVSFRFSMLDRPGELGLISTLLGQLGANILEVEHKRHFLDVHAKGARLDVTVETRDRAHADEVYRQLILNGMDVVRVDWRTGG